MIEKPVEGMEVVVTDGDCCGGLPTGTVGTIITIYSYDSFLVAAEDELWHCRRCVEGVLNAQQD